MSTKKLAILFCFVLFFLSIYAQSECADWKLFYQVDEGLKYYFDKESIVKPQTGIVQVWFKSTLEKDGSEEGEQQYGAQIEINCKSKSYRVIEESRSSIVETEEKTQKPSTAQASRRLPLESAMGSLWANLCP